MLKKVILILVYYAITTGIKAQSDSLRVIDNRVIKNNSNFKRFYTKHLDSSVQNLTVTLNNQQLPPKDDKSVWEIIPLYSSIIKTIFLVILILIIYFFSRKSINRIFEALAKRIKEGSKITAGGVTLESPELVKNTRDFAESRSDEKIFGNPDHFKTLFKIVSTDLKKSTKAMQLDNGCLVQVSTERQSDKGIWSVAEALSFIPNVKIVKDTSKGDIPDVENGYHLE